MSIEDQQQWHLDDVMGKIAEIKALPEAKLIVPMLDRLQRRLKDRGKVSSFFARDLSPEGITEILLSSYEDHGHTPPANERADVLSPKLTEKLEALTKALEPLVTHTEFLLHGMRLNIASKLAVEMAHTGEGPLSSLLNHAHDIDTLDRSHTLFDRERGHKYLLDHGVDVPPLPKGSGELIPLIEKDIAQLEAFQATLHNEGNKAQLTQLIHGYQTVLNVVLNPDTVVPIGIKKCLAPETYLAALRTINEKMRQPFLHLFQEYHDEPEFMDTLFSLQVNVMDMVKYYMLERSASKPQSRVESDGRDAQGKATPPPTPDFPKR